MHSKVTVVLIQVHEAFTLCVYLVCNMYAKQKRPGCKKSEANQKQQLSSR